MEELSLPILALVVPFCLLSGLGAGMSGYSAWPVVVPLLYVVAGVPLLETLVTSLLIDLANAVVAAPVYLRRGRADLRTAGLLALWAIPVALCGAGLAFAFAEQFSALFRGAAGYISIAIGVLVIVRAWRVSPGDAELDGSRSRPRSTPPAGLVVAAVLIGLLCGVAGVGGGFNLAAALLLLAQHSVRQAVGTALVFAALTLPVVAGAYLIFLDFHLGIWRALLLCAAASALGADAGSRFASRTSERLLLFVVGACVIAAGVAAAVSSTLAS